MIDSRAEEGGPVYNRNDTFPAIADTTPSTVELKVSLEEESAIGTVVQNLVTGGGRILSLKELEPTLETVFIELVGHGLSEATV